jgi:hypothetical protein
MHIHYKKQYMAKAAANAISTLTTPRAANIGGGLLIWESDMMQVLPCIIFYELNR